MKKLLASLILALFSLNIFAGDYSEVRILGADDQGKYLSFVEYGVQDGSGFSYVNLRVLDIANNSYVRLPNGKKVIHMMDETGDYDINVLRKLRTSAYRKARKTFKKLNISKANMDLVNFLVVNPVTEIKITDKVEFSLSPLSTYSKYSLKLETAVDVQATKKRCYDLGEAQTLKVIATTPKGVDYILQADTKVPRSRGCAFGYRVHAVITLSKKDASYNDDTQLVSLIGFSRPGFEGPDERVMAVSGTLPTVY